MFGKVLFVLGLCAYVQAGSWVYIEAAPKERFRRNDYAYDPYYAQDQAINPVDAGAEQLAYIYYGQEQAAPLKRSRRLPHGPFGGPFALPYDTYEIDSQQPEPPVQSGLDDAIQGVQRQPKSTHLPLDRLRSVYFLAGHPV